MGPGVNISKCWKPAGTYAESFINANSPTCAEHRRSQQSGANSTQGQIELSLLSLPCVKIKILALVKELLHVYECNSGRPYVGEHSPIVNIASMVLLILHFDEHFCILRTSRSDGGVISGF